MGRPDQDSEYWLRRPGTSTVLIKPPNPWSSGISPGTAL